MGEVEVVVVPEDRRRQTRTDFDLDVIRWLIEHGFDPAPEIAVLGQGL